MIVHVAMLDHGEGWELFADATEEGLLKQLVDWCKARWSDDIGEMPEDPVELIDMYADYKAGYFYWSTNQIHPAPHIEHADELLASLKQLAGAMSVHLEGKPPRSVGKALSSSNKLLKKIIREAK